MVNEERFFFASFLYRDGCFQTMSKLWNIVKETDALLSVEQQTPLVSSSSSSSSIEEEEQEDSMQGYKVVVDAILSSR